MLPSLICGVTRRVTPMSRRSTLTELARPLVLEPVADETRLVTIGMLSPIRISAVSLSEVRIWGAVMMLM